MYGYWPFEFDEYPETVFRNVPVKIWNAENRRWLTVRYTHPNIEEPFLQKHSRSWRTSWSSRCSPMWA